MIDDIGKNERSLDPNITDAEERLENAKARRGYFIMDQIKSWIVFIMSMETGNPQMAYSALEMFNKKIADSEAGYVFGYQAWSDWINQVSGNLLCRERYPL